jgi:hypothetical protein
VIRGAHGAAEGMCLSSFVPGVVLFFRLYPALQRWAIDGPPLRGAQGGRELHRNQLQRQRARRYLRDEFLGGLKRVRENSCRPFQDSFRPPNCPAGAVVKLRRATRLTIVGDSYFRRIREGELQGKLFCAMRSRFGCADSVDNVHTSTFILQR